MLSELIQRDQYDRKLWRVFVQHIKCKLGRRDTMPALRLCVSRNILRRFFSVFTVCSCTSTCLLVVAAAPDV